LPAVRKAKEKTVSVCQQRFSGTGHQLLSYTSRSSFPLEDARQPMAGAQVTAAAVPDVGQQRPEHFVVPKLLDRFVHLWGSRSRPEPVTCGDRQPRMKADVSLRLL
jgi:hypothetical protein